ncbi:MAG: hypothetical protein CVT63_04590 [Candidatus Anoxymicrobium japonicum]|uniref:L,D-TPase catalytic domain-containing protein n=1 Tax=Candidatus Anoxymicrobium japonicum TaxID=2013648 RepID=A0A2N3G5U6_9ACTN|nr:MAG: hypothetical protein CVT63_04590 [Candidatus Anoxymicrobium japonicum]
MRASFSPVKKIAMSHRKLKKAYLYVRRASGRRVLLLLSAIFLALALLVLFLSLFVLDIALSSKIFPGVTVDGNAVGGMSRNQAKAALAGTTTERIDKPLFVFHNDREFDLDLKHIELAVDADKMVEEAFKKGKKQMFLARMWRRLMNKPLSANVKVILKYDKSGLKRFIANTAENLDYAARSASIDMSKGYPVLTSSKYGRRVKQDELYNGILSILPTSKRWLAIPIETLKPTVSESDIGTILVIKQSEHKLYQYYVEKLQATYTVAVGSSQYPTPNGRFVILKKEKNPWWYPPKSDWAKDKKPIPPGPGNPLGPYFMDLGNGFGIHSTPDEASLGYSVSHGCVRMSEWSAQQVFKVVSKGTPVYILP